MRRTDFKFDLPRRLIAQKPAAQRTASKLLQLDGITGDLCDGEFLDIESLLQPGDLLIFNDTRVLPARLHGHKQTGGAIELLLERITGRHRAWVQIKSSRSPGSGAIIQLSGGGKMTVIGRIGRLFEVEFDSPAQAYFETYGVVPLPPYIERAPDNDDQERYQSVLARVPGAVAAPTASLHFSDALLERLANKGVLHASLTLHVGIGTFAPMRAEHIEEHRVHSERVEVTAELCEQIRQTQAKNGRVIAVGTTVVRALETAAREGSLAAFSGESDLYIYPGFEFRVVDAMLTNFHLPESSLLVLICAFAGQEHVLQAYRHAVNQSYRFFSYGDAMFVTPERPRQKLGRQLDEI